MHDDLLSWQNVRFCKKIVQTIKKCTAKVQLMS